MKEYVVHNKLSFLSLIAFTLSIFSGNCEAGRARKHSEDDVKISKKCPTTRHKAKNDRHSKRAKKHTKSPQRETRSVCFSPLLPPEAVEAYKRLVASGQLVVVSPARTTAPKVDEQGRLYYPAKPGFVPRKEKQVVTKVGSSGIMVSSEPS